MLRVQTCWKKFFASLSLIVFHCQILMNAIQLRCRQSTRTLHTSATLMLTVQTQKDRTTAHVSLDTLETVSLVKVNNESGQKIVL